MSKKETYINQIKRYTYITLSLLFALLSLVVIFFELFILSGISFVLGFVFLFCWAVTHKVKHDKGKRQNLNSLIKQSILDNAISLTEVKQLYKYINLDILEKPILKLFFNKDYSERCIVYKDSNAIKVVFEKINFYDDEEKSVFLKFASWQPLSYENSYYETIEIALKENSNKLTNFTEDSTPITKRKRFNAEIDWNDTSIANSNILPFDMPVKANLILKYKTIKDVLVFNNYWHDKNYSAVSIHYPENIDIDFNKNLKFNIALKNDLIFKGKFYK